MRENIKKNINSVFIILTVTIVCVGIIYISNYALSPYYKEAKSKVSQETALSILQEKYTNAYLPYKSLDNLIGEYKGIDHIYKLTFTQEMPIYVYTVTESDLGTPFTYLVIFDALGYLDDVIFLSTDNNLYSNDFTTNGNIAYMLKGQRAPHIEYDATTSASPASDFIKKGIDTAATHFAYEVKIK